ncbi:LptE family protein [Flavobacterium sp.]|jgi:hypothetical protein|uniref:LptE family protein n=1 Tax=Flavobacterium sp. TaxID=239 RepID=UPI0025B7CD6E|nr:LptE family protein [Flavobacterium sp.]
MNIFRRYFLLVFALVLSSCSVSYNFTGTGKLDAKTFQVNYFQNLADIVEPGIERTFTQKLQNVILNQTNLNLVSSGGDLLYEGEIVEYRITPMAATSDQTAAQNRMTITVNVRYTNKNKEEDNFEKRFSHFYNYEANKLPSEVMQDALKEIYDRITQDIFSQSLAKW